MWRPLLLQARRIPVAAQASAAGVADVPAQQPRSSPVAGMSDAERAALAEQMGYRQIGKDLPSDVTLQKVISTLPKEARAIFIPLLMLGNATASLLSSCPARSASLPLVFSSRALHDAACLSTGV